MLLDRIAAGGMAEIFRAKFMAAAGVTKDVVIKRILPHYAGNHAFIAMFVNEAKIAVGLNHGNIAQVFDFGEINGEYYLAMEFVHGQPLSRIGRRASELNVGIPFPICAWIAAEVSSGLHYAHTRNDEKGRPLGIIHRDVSPQNVIVSYEGQVKLVDFGIAKVLSSSQAKDGESSHLKGKYVYFSPEQARSKGLSHQTDVFATGIVLYEMLTGKRPFDGKMMEVLGRIATGDFRPPSALNPAVPAALEAICLKAMALETKDRYQSSAELAHALREYLQRSAPKFTGPMAGEYLQYTFRDELEGQGIPVKVSYDVVGKLFAMGLDAPRTDPDVARIKTSELPALGDPSRASTSEISMTSVLPRSLGARLEEAFANKLVLALFFGVLFLVGFLGVVAYSKPRTFTLKVSSTPSGATIFLDGRSSGRSPAQLDGLVADKPHQVDLFLPGKKSFGRVVPPQKGSVLTLQATLDDEEQPRKVAVLEPPPPEDTKDLTDPPDDVAPRPTLAVWPEMEVLLEPKIHAVNVLASAAARVRLDPKRAYRLTVEGEATLKSGPDSRTLTSVFFFGERAAGTKAAGSYGQLRSNAPALVTGLRALYGFIVDDTPKDNSGSLKIRITDVKTRRQAVLLVDPARNAVEPDPARFVRLSGLDPKVSYDLSLAGIADLGAGGGTVRRVCYFRSVEEGAGPTDRSQGTLDVGPGVALGGMKDVWLFLPDDERSDNAGNFTARVKVAKGK